MWISYINHVFVDLKKIDNYLSELGVLPENRLEYFRKQDIDILTDLYPELDNVDRFDITSIFVIEKKYKEWLANEYKS